MVQQEFGIGRNVSDSGPHTANENILRFQVWMFYTSNASQEPDGSTDGPTKAQGCCRRLDHSLAKAPPGQLAGCQRTRVEADVSPHVTLPVGPLVGSWPRVVDGDVVPGVPEPASELGV